MRHTGGLSLCTRQTYCLLAAFQHGPRHLALRHSFLPLFGRKALGVYLSTQMAIIQKHLSAWLAGALKGPAEVRDLVRALNQETSQSVFVGPYLDDPASFTQWYTDLTNGFLSAPIYFPGTTLWKAVEARKKVVAALTVVCQRAKLNMAQGGTPVCLVDFWAQRINEIIAECKQEVRLLRPVVLCNMLNPALHFFLTTRTSQLLHSRAMWRWARP